MKKQLIWWAILICILAGCSTGNTSNEIMMEEQQDIIRTIEQQQEKAKEAKITYPTPNTKSLYISHQWSLSDVSWWSAEGDASFGWNDETFLLDVVMTSLPELEKNFFYEWWLVRKEPFKFISTGPLTDEWSWFWSNSRTTGTDYSEFARYVLTLEPDDGDPAPAKHILEWDLNEIE